MVEPEPLYRDIQHGDSDKSGHRYEVLTEMVAAWWVCCTQPGGGGGRTGIAWEAMRGTWEDAIRLYAGWSDEELVSYLDGVKRAKASAKSV